MYNKKTRFTSTEVGDVIDVYPRAVMLSTKHTAHVQQVEF